MSHSQQDVLLFVIEEMEISDMRKLSEGETMSDLRSETEEAADQSRIERFGFGETSHKEANQWTNAYMKGATQGPPLLRALEALKLAHPKHPPAPKCLVCEALLEIEAARGSGE